MADVLVVLCCIISSVGSQHRTCPSRTCLSPVPESTTTSGRSSKLGQMVHKLPVIQLRRTLSYPLHLPYQCRGVPYVTNFLRASINPPRPPFSGSPIPLLRHPQTVHVFIVNFFTGQAVGQSLHCEVGKQTSSTVRAEYMAEVIVLQIQ